MLDRLKDKHAIQLFTDGVLAHPEMLLENFLGSLAYNTAQFMGIGMDTPRHLKNLNSALDNKVIESPTQIDSVLLKILSGFLHQNDKICLKLIQKEGFFTNSVIKVLNFCG
jgi:hypothetical protein